MTARKSPPLLLSQISMRRSLAGPLLGGTVASLTMRCPGADGPNEDSAAILPINSDRAVLAVADGVGGHRGGERASKLALKFLASSLEQASHEEAGVDGDWRGAILRGFEGANSAVLAEVPGAATTLAAIETDGRFVRPYHTGDSAIFVTGQRGRIRLRTIAHSPTGYAIESGIIDERDAMVHSERHLVSNVIGSAEMRVEVGSQLQLARRDTLVIASDGLFDNLTVDEISEIVRAGKLTDAVDALAEAARAAMDAGAPDDLTIVAYRRG